MPYCVGGFDFPTSTGTHLVCEGLLFNPKAVIMVGGNRPEVGSLVTGLANPGVFISLSGPGYLDGVLRHWMLSIGGRTLDRGPWQGYPALGTGGIRGAEVPISMHSESAGVGTIDYRASGLTLHDDGFSITVSHAASGRRPIHYIVMGEDDAVPLDVALHNNRYWQEFEQFTLPFVPSTMFCNTSEFVNSGPFTDPGALAEGSTGTTYWAGGGGHWAKGASSLNWRSGYATNLFVFDSNVHRVGWSDEFLFDGPAAWVTGGAVIFSTYSEATLAMLPIAAGSQTMRTTSGPFGGTQTVGGALIWDGNGWCSHADANSTYEAPALGTEDFGDWKAILFSTINKEGIEGGGGSAQSAWGWGVLGIGADEETIYQGCCAFGADGSFYQSTSECGARMQYSFAASPPVASSVDTIVGSIDGQEFTIVDGQGTSFDGFWHGWGEEGGVPTVMQRRRYASLKY